ncbi:carotenoid biosynthesis protein [Halorarum halophilum]|uniref:Carotenoid biosynthesis protein n=1 Tax=Halorarum halophilum TaxID=2743090 RepID=A0A7D5KTD7_9EURY|nr:bisanhydrobacterioruberin hydratase [Halobaculum halophilum]QLG26160.1 carotenoid biosynthesis protein [Halobaculum halophilum]
MSTVASTVREWWPDDRRDAETRLEALVRGNRFTISVVFPLIGIVLLLASATVPAVPDWLAFNGTLVLLGTLVMRSPLIAAVAPVADRRALAGVGLLTLYAYGIEYVGVHTGWPYGAFEYGVALGPMAAGVPLGLPVFFLPLVANAYLLCLLLLGDRAEHAATRLGAVVALVLLMDVVLDPGAVALGFWSYDDVARGGALAALSGGGFYGVPLSNFGGWILSATVAVATFDAAFDRAALRRRLADCEFALDDMVSFVILWGGVNAAFGNAVPALVAALIGYWLVRANRFDASLLRP